MRSKHEIPHKTDYMKAYSFNLIQTERTNSELEHERNVGKIDGAFYRNFSWQIMGKKKERQLSQCEPNDIIKTKRHEALSELSHAANSRLQERSTMLVEIILLILVIILLKLTEMLKIEKRQKYLPAKIKKDSQTGDLFIKLIERVVRVQPQEHKEGRVVVQTRTDLKGRSPQRYVTTCYFKPRVIPAWFTESLLIHIGSTKRVYDEKVWFKHKLQPYYWSESMTTEVNFPLSISHTSTAAVSVAEPQGHYISLEPQQIAAGAS